MCLILIFLEAFMEQVDVLIIGAATAGSFLARRLAQAGHRVLILEQQSKENLGRRLDIFHVAKADFVRFSLPLPEQADDFAFEFSGGKTFSAFDRYPKQNTGTGRALQQEATCEGASDHQKNESIDGHAGDQKNHAQHQQGRRLCVETGSQVG